MSEPAANVLRALSLVAQLPVDSRPVSELTVAEARARTRQVWVGFWNVAPPRIETVVDRLVPTSEGEIPIRLYDPASDKTRPIVYFHGGGFVVGDLDTHDGIPRRLALYSGRPVISVDYRRAPEHPYPQPLADCTAVVEALSLGSHGLEIDASQLALAGDSAGANLALGSLLRLRDLGICPAAAALFFGNYDPHMRADSYARYGAGYGLSALDVAWFWRQYLGDRINSPPLDAAPLGADLEGLPPLFVGAAECDPVGGDSFALAQFLQERRLPHTFRLWSGMIHGCIGMAREINQADAQLAEASVWLQTHLSE